jgi:hypothetical protein
MLDSCGDHAAVAQLFEERQQRHSKDSEIVAGNRFKELNAEALELISANRFSHALAGTRQVLNEKALGKIPHGQFSAVGTRP